MDYGFSQVSYVEMSTIAFVPRGKVKQRQYTTVSTKDVSQQCKRVHDHAD